jgi:hypothetical protein
MKIIEDKNVRNIIIICITLLSLLELYFAYRVVSGYAGVYQVGIFIPVMIQPFSYYALLKRQMSYFKLRVVLVVLITLILPSIIYFTLPNYTYNEGKQMVEKHMQSIKNIEFVDISRGKATLPITGNPKRLFVSDRAYYYEIKSTIGNRYFMVNPITGEVVQLSEESARYFYGVSNGENISKNIVINYEGTSRNWAVSYKIEGNEKSHDSYYTFKYIGEDSNSVKTVNYLIDGPKEGEDGEFTLSDTKQFTGKMRMTGGLPSSTDRDINVDIKWNGDIEMLVLRKSWTNEKLP